MDGKKKSRKPLILVTNFTYRSIFFVHILMVVQFFLENQVWHNAG
jgi:hypothetical protein